MKPEPNLKAILAASLKLEELRRRERERTADRRTEGGSLRREPVIAFVSITISTTASDGTPLVLQTWCVGDTAALALKKWRTDHPRLAKLKHEASTISPTPATLNPPPRIASPRLPVAPRV